MKFYQIAKLVQYQFTEVSDFLWKSLGNNVRIFDFHLKSPIKFNISMDGSIYVNTNGDVLLFNVTITDECVSNEVNQEANPICNSQSFIWVDPYYSQDYIQEHTDRSIPFNEDNSEILFSQDNVLELLNSHLTSPESLVSVELDDDLIISMSKMAHERDITFNDLVNEVLYAHMQELSKKTKKNIPNVEIQN